MQKNGDDYEPIIATRRSREPLHEDAQPLWRLVLLLGAGLAVAVSLIWWWTGRSPSDSASTTEETQVSMPETEVSAPEVHVEQEPAPPAPAPAPNESESSPDLAQAPAPGPSSEPAVAAEQAATPEATQSIPQDAPDTAVQSPSPPAPVSVRLMSPDAQVRFELRGPLDSSPTLTSKAGDVVALAPGTYRVVASGNELETLEQDVTIAGDRPLDYTVELCAQPKQEIETLTGRIIEERACASTAECETMFMIMSEQAEKLVNDSAFRKQECAKWRADSAPNGRWTLDTKCDGATLATTCRIEIAQGACTDAEPRRSVRGGACPQSEIKHGP